MAIRLNPYLVLDGQAKEAIEFYRQVLGAEVISVQTFGDMPADPEFSIPDEAKDRILHALIRVGESELMFSDTFPGQSVEKGNHVALSVVTDSLDQTQAIFGALQEGGQVNMPLQETFWSPAYGAVTDRFGIMFNISTDTKK